MSAVWNEWPMASGGRGMAWRLAATAASRAGSRRMPLMTAATVIERIERLGAEEVEALSPALDPSRAPLVQVSRFRFEIPT